MTASHVKISSVHELTKEMSKNGLQPGWHYYCSFHPPVRLDLTNVVLLGHLKQRPDVRVLISFKGFAGAYRSMNVSFRSHQSLSKTTCGAWLSTEIIPLFKLPPSEFESRLHDLIIQDGN
jgi:hypothetical protein